MKKLLLLTVLLFSLTNLNSFGQIWVNWVSASSSARPFSGTWYLGDQIKQGNADWYYNWEINYTSNWNLSEVGIGKEGSFPLANTTWYLSSKYGSDGSNSLLHSNIGDYRFTSTGNYFVAGQAKGSDNILIYENGPWQNIATTLSPSTSSGYTAYFVVNALNNPSSQVAASNPTTPQSKIDLSWSPDEQGHFVMIVRKKSTDSWEEPAQGTAYAVGASIGSGKVVYLGNGSSTTDINLSPATGYDYKFYSENYSYYSEGVTSTTVFTSPSIFTVGGGGSYCSGGSVNITLDDSEAGVTYELWKDGVATGTTLSGTGNALDFQNVTAAGTYTIKGTIDDITVTMTGSAIVTVNALPAAVTVEGAGTFCATATITASIEGDGTIYFQGTTSGGTSTLVESTSEVITTSGTYYFRAQSAEGCWGQEGSAVVTINAPVTTSVGIVASANPVVSGTSVEFTATPVNGGTPSYAWYLDGDLQELIITSTFSTNPINGTQVYVVMTSSLPCTSPVQSNTITMIVSDAPATSTWDGSSDNNWHNPDNWSDGVPGSTTNISIPFTGITNFPTISSAATCHNFTLKSGASILGNNKLSVTGITSVERFFVGNEWHLLSSPIQNANTGMFTGKYLQYHNTADNKYYDILSADSAITVAKGYAIWGGSGFNRTFVGPMNNNNKSYSVSAAGEGWNLVGNPYPSGIDWDLIVLPTGIANAIYKHVNNSSWATYIDDVSVPEVNDESLIAPCQGFFVKATGNATLQFTDAARIHAPITYYKQSNNRVSNLVRLQVSGNGYQDETVIRFLPESTAEFDGSYDALKMNGDVPEAAQIYSWGGIELAINSLPETNMVPVGIHVGATGTYTIAATEINDLNYITLEDTKTATFTELANKSYTFDFIAGENEQRFKLHFSSVGIDEKETTTANIYSYQQTVYVNFNENINGDIYIYNLAGQLITAKESASGNVRIGLTSTGVYMVKVVTEKETLTQKVVIR